MASSAMTVKLVFSGHALGRMFERGIAPHEVRSVLERGESIEEYADDKPFPSSLMLGVAAGRTIHVVFAIDRSTSTAHVVTAYVPDPGLWESDFKRRRK
jgi:hypothetical protein